MILAVDVGNTNTVLGCLEGERVTHTLRVRTMPGMTDAECAIQLQSLFFYYKLDPAAFEGAILSSVVPSVTEPLRRAIERLTGKACLVVGPGLKTGLNLRVDDPGTVAGDLVVGAVAALHRCGGPVIVMDLGTATTITLVDRDGSFRGGAILPGVRLSYGALSAGASLLPEISIEPPKKCIATNTVDCMRSGAVYGTAATLDGMIDRMEAELGEKCALIATGGLASSIVPYCRHEILCDDDLLLTGLRVLWEKNR